MTTAKPRALVLGHSFVRGIADFIDRKQGKKQYRRDLNLTNFCDVKIFRVGGRTIARMIRLDLTTVKSTTPNVVILDICDYGCDAETVALSIVAFTELLITSQSAIHYRL